MDGRYELAEQSGIGVLRWPALAECGVDAVVTTRHGGVSTGPYATLNLGLHVGDDPRNVVENRRRALAAVGLGLGDAVFCRQSHGNVVAEVGAPQRGRGSRAEADALDGVDAQLTSTAGLAVVVMVADCVPLILVEPEARLLAVVHAGWRGTVAGVTPAAVAAMARQGGDPGRVVAAIGPAIPPERYEVGADVADAARSAFGDAVDALLRPRARPGTWGFDLWGANRLQLRAAGIAEERILLADVPTDAEGPFFSDRAQRPCGRFAAIAVLR